MNQQDELQKLLDLIDEKILFLRQKKITEASPLILFQLDKEIQEAEAERENLARTNNSHELYNVLLRLNYQDQLFSFAQFLKTESIGAFLIQGLPDYGQRWLLNRLVKQYLSYGGKKPKEIPIELRRISRKNDINTLWRELGGWLGLPLPQKSLPNILEKAYQFWKTQHLIIVFHDIDFMPESYLPELLNNFWLPLANRALENLSPVNNFKLLMFLVDYQGDVGTEDTIFVEKIEPTWQPKKPIKLPQINPFCDRILTDWIRTLETDFELCNLEVTNKITNMQDPVKEILEESENGIPEEALEAICGICGCEWYTEKDKWLTL
ncbi:hypothetical protein [Calothrix sp. NIES-2098]|uniref:hypothetical protein n=1 Tax=Calothrix sp. NIES-2098 TaxID=1954171 RepID=UPI000B5F21F7|nr:hypothetical protein NIES2098_55320 [Calothrix sp. NIES-2098]